MQGVGFTVLGVSLVATRPAFLALWNWSNAMLQWVEITGGLLRGRQLYIDPYVEAWNGMARGFHEPFIFESLGDGGVYESKIVWDIGAFMGYHALAFAALVGEAGRVLTFEPNPFNVERIEMNLGRNPDLASRVLVVPQALSDRDGEETFIFSRSIETGESSGSHMSSALAPEQASVYAAFEQATVKTARADTLLRDGRLPPPDLIKLDVEGAEFMVLKGAIEMLTSVRPTILVEVHHILTMFHIQQLLTSLGYELSVVKPDDGMSSRCHVLAKPSSG